MAEVQTPTLEDLRHSSDPAWLWDWQAQRIVWANAAGLIYFGCETLFDLIDRPFDLAEAGVAAIVDAGRTLRRGQTAAARLHFPSTGVAEGLDVNCHVHALPDGRPGLLVAARTRWGAANGIGAETLAAAFEALPGAALVVDKAGDVRHANAAASRLLGAHAADIAGELMARAKLAGTVSAVRTVDTPLGVRDIRLTLRIMPEGGEAHAVILAEDVTARRALEKKLSAAAAPPVPAQPQGLSPAEADAFTALGQVLRSETAGSEAPGPPPRRDEVPEFIQRALDAMPGANLFLQQGRLEHASPAAVALLGFGDKGDVLNAAPLAAALKELAPGRAVAELPCADGASRQFSLTFAQIPWRDGPAQRLTLAPAEATAEAPPEAAPAPAPAAVPAAEPMVADAELRAILDTASDGLVMLDQEGRILSLSAGAEAIFGYRSAEVVQKPFAELMTGESKRTVKDYLAALQGPGLAAVFNDGREVTAVVKQGGEVPLFLTIARLQAKQPGTAAFCAVVREITQWKKTEAELRQARDEAERQSRLKSEFLANVSHELRTPLNAILGFSEMMRIESFGAIGNEKYRSYINDIHSSGRHLLALINDLLDLSKVEAGKLELNFTSVNLGEVVEHAFRLVQEQATQRRVLLRKALPADLPNVVADLRAMRQILINLLANAVKFTDPGGQVIVSAAVSPEGELTLKVKDTGLGMSPEALAQAMEPFRRVKTAGREAEGTGLGLPLTKALAEANRTRFAIESAPGQGTTVAITFPTTRVLAM